MSDHEVIRSLIAVVALGAATEQEIADVERHAATCSDCRDELDGLRAATTGLALDVPQLDPPAALKRKVLAAVHDGSVRRGRAGPGRPWPRFALWPAAAAAFGALAIGLFAWNVSLRGGDSAREIAFVGAGGASGKVVITDDGTAVMRITGLPALAASQGYELWTIRGGKPRSEGFAARTEGGDIVVATGDIGDAKALAVTAEERANTAAPTQDPLVTVPL